MTRHLAAVLVIGLVAALFMRGWLDGTRLPAGDFAGYAAEVESVRQEIARDGRVPVWDARRFGGSTRFMSSVKEIAAFPLAQAFGAVTGTKIMFAAMRVASALAMYALFVRQFGAPVAGVLAGSAYAFGSIANYETGQGGHLDVAISSALFPLVMLAAVAMLRRGSWTAAGALGLLVAIEFAGTSYLQAMVCPLIVLVVTALRPWVDAAGEHNPLADGALARRWLTRTLAALGVFLVFGGSQLAWFVADRKHHELLQESAVAWGIERFVEQSPFLYVNRGDWLGAWLEHHRPPMLALDSESPLFNERRYLGLVAIGVCLVGWFAVRRNHSLRRWYQTFAILLLTQYWLSIGPGTLLWQLGQTFHWPSAVVGGLRVLLTLGGIGGFGWAFWLRRCARAGASVRPGRIELGLGLGLFCIFLSNSLFGFLRDTLPLLGGMRSPGHFFDLAPFSFYALFGVSIVGFERAISRPAIRHRMAAALGLALLMDFWPSAAALQHGKPIEPLRRMTATVAGLDAEDGSLRLASPAWKFSGDASLVGASGKPGVASSWINWQAGRGWVSYVKVALGGARPSLDAEQRGRLRPIGDALTRIARIRYALDDLAIEDRAIFAEPWRLRAEEGTLALWERPDVEPMATGYRAYVLHVGGSDGARAIAVTQAFAHGVVQVTGGDRLAANGEDTVRRAALVRCDGSACDDPTSRALADRHRERLVEVTDAASGARWEERLAALPRVPLLPVAYERPAAARIRLVLDAGAAPAVVLISESHHPWWQATVDGRPAEVLRAAWVFMAIAVEPGRHVIELALRRPALVAAADWTTAAAWNGLVLGTLLALLVRRR